MSEPRTPLDQIETVRNRLALFLVVAFVGVLPFLLYKDIPKDNEQLLTYMLGQLSGMATMALGFYFVNKVGQDALDAAKTDNTGKALDAITAAAKAGGSEDTAAIREGDTITLEKEP